MLVANAVSAARAIGLILEILLRPIRTFALREDRRTPSRRTRASRVRKPVRVRLDAFSISASLAACSASLSIFGLADSGIDLREDRHPAARECVGRSRRVLRTCSTSAVSAAISESTVPYFCWRAGSAAIQLVNCASSACRFSHDVAAAKLKCSAVIELTAVIKARDVGLERDPFLFVRFADQAGVRRCVRQATPQGKGSSHREHIAIDDASR